jgi:hypothetical protein
MYPNRQVLAGLVSKYETSASVSPINSTKGPSPEGSFSSNANNTNNVNNAKPSPETSSKSHDVEKSLFTLSPDSSFHFRSPDVSFKELSSSFKDQLLRVDTFSENWLEASPIFNDSERSAPAVQEVRK